MKKTPRKLVLRQETVRALAVVDLARAVAGVGSGEAQCLVAPTDTHAAACPGTVAVVRTAMG
jgi:hypothetical protein